MTVESIKKSVLLGFICSIAAFGGLLFGYDTGIISSALLFISKDFDLDTGQKAWIVSVIALGAIVGALISGPLYDKVGRKKIILLSSLLFMASASLLAWAPTVNWLIYGRCLIGLAIGITSSIAPLYIAELAPKSHRGALVTINQLAITIGIFAAFLIGYALATHHNWRLMFFLSVIPAAIQFFTMLFFPESPRWLISKGKKEKALSILERFRDSKEDAELEVQHISQHVTGESPRLKELFSRQIRPALIAGMGLTIIQQATGINSILYYASTIFKMVGFASDKSAIYASIWIGGVNVLMTLVALCLLDIKGRKPLLIVGLSGMIIALITLGLGFIIGSNPLMIGWICIISLMVYIGSFAFSLGPTAWLINSEIYPLQIRGRAIGLVTCTNWASNFLITSTFLYLVEFMGKSGVFWVYAAIGIAGLWFISKKIPETKDKSLEEIEEYWKSQQH